MRDYSKQRYRDQMNQSRKRNIPWNLSYDQWLAWWDSQGIDKRSRATPRTGNTMCMCRKGDTGPYDLNNIYCATASQNGKDIWINHKVDINKMIQARRARS